MVSEGQAERESFPKGVEDVLSFPFIEALHGRRARRFGLGSAIPGGPFEFKSRHDPEPLSELEEMLVVTAAAGNTGWHYMLPHTDLYSSQLPAYPSSAGGRTFPSAAGYHTTELFFTNDRGTYMLETRDAPALVDPGQESVDLRRFLEAHRSRVRVLSDRRLDVPPAKPHVAAHNTWCANRPGSLLLMPISDVAQYLIASMCYMVLNGSCLYDDVNDERIPGLDRFSHLVDVDSPSQLTSMERNTMASCATEISISCYAGMLMLQAMGLGGWMYSGIDGFSVMGATDDPNVRGLGFRYDRDERWPSPNPTGLPGVFEGHCPPHFANMREAVEAHARRKFGPGGPFHESTPGPWRDSSAVRSSVEPHSDEFIECVSLMAQYIYDRFGRFPATVPAMYSQMYLQVHHLDLEFYDRYYGPGAYLQTHARHMERWH